MQHSYENIHRHRFRSNSPKINIYIYILDDIEWKNPPTFHSFEFVTIDEGSVVTDLLTMNADSNNDVLQLDSKLLRLASPLISKSLTHLFNLSLMSRVIPSDWKLARITPIHKGKGSVNAEANYCPISVLSHVVKIFEKQVHKQLIEYLEAHAFITPYQSAYLKKHSTVTCLHRVVDDLCENIDDGDLCGVCFLDIEKCFDSINHKILLQKLKYYGIDKSSLEWFQNYLHGRSQCVRVNNVTSDEKPCHIGVPQGSILGPLLFLLYVNDLPQYVQNQNCNIFADDTIIYSFGSNVEELSCKMQGALDSIMPWYMTNRLSINANKSAVMLIGRPSQVHDDIDIKINDVRIEQVQSMKYLGIYIDNKLSWDVQCDKLCSNVAGKISVLRRIRQFCRPSTLKLIYERTIQPTFDYACSVWCHTKQGNISKLQRAQNYAARIVTGNFDYVNFRSADLLYELDWASIKERCDYFTSVMMFKAINGLTPPYLTDSIVRANEAHDRNTRLASSYDVHVPSHNSEILKRSFVYNGSVLWNSLRHELKLADNVNTFKRMYKDMILFPSQLCS